MPLTLAFIYLYVVASGLRSFFCFTIVPSLREKVDLKFDIGAVFHRAMVASAPGEKLLIGRRPVRN